MGPRRPHVRGAFPTVYGGIGEAIGAYGRGLVQVLDPGGTPLFTD